jgi:flagellar motility protein MotE (MotC chaperone)
MMKNLRILPITVISMVLVFGLKISSFWNDAQGLIFDIDVAQVQAQTKEDVKKEDDAAASNEDVGATEEEGTAEKEREDFDVSNLSESEIEVLQKLTERREQLETREQELEMRDNLLQATEKRIDEKIVKLKEIEATIQELLKKHDKDELTRLKSLVSIYEKMKPKDAASIFKSLDMKVLLDIAGLMKESKLAVILGNMSGARAKELTIELATRKQLPGVKGSNG